MTGSSPAWFEKKKDNMDDELDKATAYINTSTICSQSLVNYCIDVIQDLDA